MEVEDYKCLSCSAPLKYNPERANHGNVNDALQITI